VSAMDPVAALNLSRAFEDRLLAAPAAAGRVPAVVISGFLGSGKTTVVRSLLRSRGNLRFAVIMNEFAGVDVDSALLGGASANAAVGLPLLSLPDGCCCCSGSAALRDALQQVLRSASGSVDAMLLETTGLANPAPLADALAKGGAALACVATVVDAEAARAQLAGPAAATLHAQVRCADLVVLNKVRGRGAPHLRLAESLTALLRAVRPGRPCHFVGGGGRACAAYFRPDRALPSRWRAPGCAARRAARAAAA
jgi:G3E family GTPase